jgi:hypothetical protein
MTGSSGETEWERDVKSPAYGLPKYGATYSPIVYEPLPPEFFKKTQLKMTGVLDVASVPERVVVHWPDGTTTETTWAAMMAAGMVVTPGGLTEGEMPTGQVTITYTDDPPADEPHVVEDRK